MGLPVPATAVVEVREELIANTEDLVFSSGAGGRFARRGSNSARGIRGHSRKLW